MKISICNKNKHKILSVISAAEGRAKVRTINYIDLVDYSENAETLLDLYNVNKMNRVGFQYEYAENDTAKAYKSAVKSTYIKLHRGSNRQWFLVDIERKSLFAGNKSIDNLRLPKDYGLKLIIDTVKNAQSEGRGYNQKVNRIQKQIIIPDNDIAFEKRLEKELVTVMLLLNDPTVNLDSENYLDLCIEQYPEHFI